MRHARAYACVLRTQIVRAFVAAAGNRAGEINRRISAAETCARHLIWLEIATKAARRTFVVVLYQLRCMSDYVPLRIEQTWCHQRLLNRIGKNRIRRQHKASRLRHRRPRRPGHPVVCDVAIREVRNGIASPIDEERVDVVAAKRTMTVDQKMISIW